MSQRRLLAAPDKFRGTALAIEVANAIANGAQRAGWIETTCPLADGGEGLLDLVDGEVCTTHVRGPLGESVPADWCFLDNQFDSTPTAIIEMATASGISLVGGREGNDPVAASTYGTGQLIVAAIDAGARRVIVGCGGSATTDGGQGALEALEQVDLSNIELIVASDTDVGFLDAAEVFATQKGADPETVAYLSNRLATLFDSYRSRFGVDLSAHAGTGAAGGLSGALLARGGSIVSGFHLVSQLVKLDEKICECDLVVTGEGKFDESSLRGKVVGGIIEKAAGTLPVLIVAGTSDQAARNMLPQNVNLIDLSDRFGVSRSINDPVTLIAEVVAEFCRFSEK